MGPNLQVVMSMMVKKRTHAIMMHNNVAYLVSLLGVETCHVTLWFQNVV